MRQREARFTVNASAAELWRFIRDFESLCTCIPGVEHIERLDDSSVELTVKEKVGVVPLIVDLTARIDAEDPPHSLHAVAKAEHLTMEIDVVLTESGAQTERITLAVQSRRRGAAQARRRPPVRAPSDRADRAVRRVPRAALRRRCAGRERDAAQPRARDGRNHGLAPLARSNLEPPPGGVALCGKIGAEPRRCRNVGPIFPPTSSRCCVAGR
jgi:carbon monoxide dehydrogenase subunit G